MCHVISTALTQAILVELHSSMADLLRYATALHVALIHVQCNVILLHCTVCIHTVYSTLCVHSCVCEHVLVHVRTLDHSFVPTGHQ